MRPAIRGASSRLLSLSLPSDIARVGPATAMSPSFRLAACQRWHSSTESNVNEDAIEVDGRVQPFPRDNYGAIREYACDREAVRA